MHGTAAFARVVNEIKLVDAESEKLGSHEAIMAVAAFAPNILLKPYGIRNIDSKPLITQQEQRLVALHKAFVEAGEDVSNIPGLGVGDGRYNTAKIKRMGLVDIQVYMSPEGP